MEDYLGDQIRNNSVLQTIMGAHRPAEEWYFLSSSLGLPGAPIPEKPYIVCNELADFVHDAVQETSDSRTRNFQLFVYDHKGDFTNVNRALNELRTLVKQMAPFTTEDQINCSESRWGGMSGFITDDGWDASVRYGMAQFTVSG